MCTESPGWGNLESKRDVDGDAGAGGEGFGVSPTPLFPLGRLDYGDGPGIPCHRAGVPGDSVYTGKDGLSSAFDADASNITL